jgi:antitoxin HicB
MSEVLIRLQIEALPEGVYLATSDDLPGLLAQGRTLAETIEIAQDVARKLIESYHEHGDPLPPALRKQAPKRFTLQVPLGVGAWDD